MTENKNTKLGWINGHWGIFKDLKVPINDRGLNFADGIFETILIFNGLHLAIHTFVRNVALQPGVGVHDNIDKVAFVSALR